MLASHQTGGSGNCPRTPKREAMRGNRVRVVKASGSSRNASTSSAFMYSLSTHWNGASSGRSPPGQRTCVAPRASSDGDGNTPVIGAQSQSKRSVASLRQRKRAAWS